VPYQLHCNPLGELELLGTELGATELFGTELGATELFGTELGATLEATPPAHALPVTLGFSAAPLLVP
jgi:hypothetical protein